MRTDWVDATVALYAAMLRDCHQFAQTAYGDGEWRCILGEYPDFNVNGEDFSPFLGSALARTLMEPAGQWCVFWPADPPVATGIRGRALEWLNEHRPPVQWLPFRPLNWASREGQAGPIWEALHTRRVILVGPEHLKRVPGDVLDPFIHIETPNPGASDVWLDLALEAGDHVRDEDVVLVCAGMASNLIVHELCERHGPLATFWDIGSTLDPYAGVLSRSGYTEPGFATMLEANTP